MSTVKVTHMDVIVNVVRDVYNCMPKQRDHFAYIDGESSPLLWIIGLYLSDYTASHSRRQ